jgi:hypothetical protein
MRQVLRQMPWQLVVDADTALAVHGDDKGDPGQWHKQ